MSILIKGTEMPKACEWCSFISAFTTESGLGCRYEVKKFEFRDYSKRQENCPLVEVPTPHGRLIDADALLKIIEESGMLTTGICRAINVAPTIIEAEE